MIALRRLLSQVLPFAAVAENAIREILNLFQQARSQDVWNNVFPLSIVIRLFNTK